MISATIGPAAVDHLNVESIYSSAHTRITASVTIGAIPDFAIKDSTPAEQKFLKLEAFAVAMMRVDEAMRARLDLALHWYDLGEPNAWA